MKGGRYPFQRGVGTLFKKVGALFEKMGGYSYQEGAWVRAFLKDRFTYSLFAHIGYE